MVNVMKDIGGVEMPEYLARLTPEARAREMAADGSQQPNGAAPAAVPGTTS
jgi:hypothetical protein